MTDKPQQTNHYSYGFFMYRGGNWYNNGEISGKVCNKLYHFIEFSRNRKAQKSGRNYV